MPIGKFTLFFLFFCFFGFFFFAPYLCFFDKKKKKFKDCIQLLMENYISHVFCEMMEEERREVEEKGQSSRGRGQN